MSLNEKKHNIYNYLYLPKVKNYIKREIKTKFVTLFPVNAKIHLYFWYFYTLKRTKQNT